MMWMLRRYASGWLVIVRMVLQALGKKRGLPIDPDQILTGMLGYFINGGTVEPKLKFKIAPLDGAAAGGVTLEQLVAKIILGPNGASVRSTMAVRRMLETLGKPLLAERVVTSSTPYRAK